MFTPNRSSPLTELRRANLARDVRCFWASTAKGLVIGGLLLLLLMVTYDIALHALDDLRVRLGYKE